MNLINLYLLLFFPLTMYAAKVTKTFTTNLTILPIIVISETKPLSAPSEISGQAKDIVVLPIDSFAASFNAVGSPTRNFTKSIVQTSVTMITGTGSTVQTQLIVDNFTLGGPSSFDSSGNAVGITVGATFHLKNNNIAGDYTGSATLRLIYL